MTPRVDGSGAGVTAVGQAGCSGNRAFTWVGGSWGSRADWWGGRGPWEASPWSHSLYHSQLLHSRMRNWPWGLRWTLLSGCTLPEGPSVAQLS